ncbi:unnamed protein product [Lathyrus sativus]|nr:unnamed protein product [Lathyrus sativus]
MNRFIYFGVILDPRYKLGYVDGCFNDMYSDESVPFTDLIGMIKRELFELLNWYKGIYDQQYGFGSSTSPIEGSSLGDSVVPDAEVASHFARIEAFKEHLKQKDSIDKKNDLERYLDDKYVDDSNSDILMWWKQNSCRYPILAKMVKDVLASHMSTVASESTFSTGGRVLDTYRSSLSPKMAEASIYAQNWLKPTLSQFKDRNINEDFEVFVTTISKFNGPSARGSTSGGDSDAVGKGKESVAGLSQSPS